MNKGPRHLAIEAELQPSERTTLAAWLDVLRLPADGWRGIPGLVDALESVAVGRVASRMQRAKGCSRTLAIEEACDALGIKVESHRRRLLRWWHRCWPTRDTLSLTTEDVSGIHSVHGKSHRSPRRAA